MRESIEKYAERQARRRFRRKKYTVAPARVRARLSRIENAKAVLWDVYGTLLAVAFGDIESSLARKETMRDAFRLTAREFGIESFLGADPADALREMYIQEIEKTHRRKRSHGVFSPEVRIEETWLRVLRKLESRGYRPISAPGEVTLDLAYRIAYFFDDVYHAKVLYAGARYTLAGIRKLGLKQGIISNAQFYTPIALRLLLQKPGNRRTNPLKELFDERLIFFSYDLGVSKPNPLAFELARDRLKRTRIEPASVLYVGNDMCNDMVPARAVGFKCVLFAGDRESLTLRQNRPECVDFEPDAVIKALPDLLKVIQ
jgi:putative hydrolase of the HAD superfamily